MAGGVRRVPGSAVVAQVEGQEPGLLTRQLGRHRDPVGSTAKWTRARRAKVTFLGPGRAVLLHGVLDALVGEGVLQLGCGRRDAVDEEHQVEGVVDRRSYGN